MVFGFSFGSYDFTKLDPSDDYGGCLLLSPYIKQGSAGALNARNLSRVDPDSFFGLKTHSGFINVNEKYGSNLFFLLFPTERLEVTPWIIWLGGGPGVTSMKGLFEIMGPLKIEDGQGNFITSR